MILRKLLFAILLGGLLLSACAGLPATPENRKTPLPPPSDMPTQPADEGQSPFPPAVTAARQALAEMLAIDPAATTVAAYAPAEWPDSCLGLGGTAESCLQALTPGYRVVLQAGSEFYVFRTDQDGAAVRQELAAAELPQAAVNARRDLAAKLGLAHELLVSVLSAEPVDWGDSCLGVDTPGILCLQVITPGYRVVLEAGGQRYEVHTDATGERLVLLEPGRPSTGETLPGLVWQSPEEPCQRVEISARQVNYGACGAPLSAGRLDGVRLAEMANYLAAYAPFEAETPSGWISFRGQGSLKTGPAEQRALAEWARLMLLEAQSGRSTPDQGLALAWHREGGIAGFCDDLLVYAYGRVQATNCKSSPADARTLQLDAAQLEQLFTWLDGYLPIQDYQTDPATADAMTRELLLNGTGSRAAGDAEKQALSDFASALYAQAME